ncbi:hypothetical protein ACTIVE_5140 [Actinomadura verrucosospora]|uniref:Uncharacterized protein n=1 Tax=Actinomadura verrucosospora TaxID=46165 RepID=A0A7D3ZH82_ACTVE|nr:hypothetical protein ACTIVE_5140 [Actinomadura verrucosospora]
MSSSRGQHSMPEAPDGAGRRPPVAGPIGRPRTFLVACTDGSGPSAPYLPEHADPSSACTRPARSLNLVISEDAHARCDELADGRPGPPCVTPPSPRRTPRPTSVRCPRHERGPGPRWFRRTAVQGRVVQDGPVGNVGRPPLLRGGIHRHRRQNGAPAQEGRRGAAMWEARPSWGSPPSSS